MACRLCNTLKLKRLRRLDRDIKVGKKSVVQLADKYDTSVKRIRRHMETCLGPKEESGHQLLSALLKKIEKDLNVARTDALYGDEEQSRGASILYTSLVREARELVMALEKTKPNAQIGREIQNAAVHPFVAAMSKIVNEEGGNLQTEFTTLLGEHYDKSVQKALVEAFRRIAKRLNVEYKLIDGRIAEVLSRNGGTSESSSSKAQPSSQFH